MTKRRRIVIPVLLVLAALVAALLLLSKYGLAVTRLSLEFDDLPRGFDGFKIVQLSDLHGSEFGRDNARLIKAVAQEEPDIIALTGDFLDEGKAGQELPADCDRLPILAALWETGRLSCERLDVISCSGT